MYLTGLSYPAYVNNILNCTLTGSDIRNIDHGHFLRIRFGQRKGRILVELLARMARYMAHHLLLTRYIGLINFSLVL